MLARAEDDTLHVAYVPAGRSRPHGDRRLGRHGPADDGQRHRPPRRRRGAGRPGPARTTSPSRGPNSTARSPSCCTPPSTPGSPAGALAEAAEFVRTKSRPWFESGVETAAEDPLLIQRFGELAIRVRASEALLREAARAVDAARADLTDDSAAEASIAVAAAKVQAAQTAVEVGERPLRGVRHPVGAQLPEPAPALARRPHPHPARPGPLEDPAHRPVRAERHPAAPPRPPLATYGPSDRRPTCPSPSTGSSPPTATAAMSSAAATAPPPPSPDGTGRRRSPTSARSPAPPRTWASSARSPPPAPGARTRG